jgi:hypothetical protein
MAIPTELLAHPDRWSDLFFSLGMGGAVLVVMAYLVLLLFLRMRSRSIKPDDAMRLMSSR